MGGWAYHKAQGQPQAPLSSALIPTHHLTIVTLKTARLLLEYQQLQHRLLVHVHWHLYLLANAIVIEGLNGRERSDASLYRRMSVLFLLRFSPIHADTNWSSELMLSFMTLSAIALCQILSPRGLLLRYGLK